MHTMIYRVSLLAILLINITGIVRAETNLLDDIRLSIKQGEYKEAIAKIESMPNIERNWQAHFMLGTAYLLGKQLEEAANALDYALELQSNIVEIWIQRAIVAQEQGKPNAALQLLAVAKQVKPDCPEIYLNAAYANEHLNRIEAARAAYGHYLKLSSIQSKNGHLRQHILSRLVNFPYGEPSSS